MSITAMKQAFDALLFVGHTSRSDTAIAVCAEATDVLRQAIAQAEKQQALDKKADNARELGLDYESTHTDHPMRHWDRTCPVCVEQEEKQEQFCDNHCTWRDHHSDCVRAEKQEPVAWRWLYNGKPDSHKCFDGKGPDADVILRAASSVMPRTVQYFYTAPPSKPWVSLTDEEEIELDEKYGYDINAYIDARDAKLKEKNT